MENDLIDAESAVTRNDAVMGGEPVFRGTRVPVYLVAAMLDQGAGEAEILDGYPTLEARHLHLARVWTAAHPQRGRPKILADQGVEVRSRMRIPLSLELEPATAPTAGVRNRSA